MPETVNVKLTQQDWQVIINILAEQPYKLTAQLIAQIINQVQAAQAQSQPGLPLNNGENDEQKLLQR
jgi:hypothetical protein